ncbi:ferredoxin family protein [Metallumcola ferriviriculae]|uniref:Ferredoxin family protein n=1 Tax=Metallumcola ferriviriculae TaxID=3039180 RepID=A0AAU0UNQ4_9FIRM|nr:ferredoxin family protein [Desulfitibacteraceae bacterium MK1]
MSILIDPAKCISCGRCCNICPGNLIETGNTDKAFIKYPTECWGCTACLKECPAGAIKYYLGEDIGGKGGYLYTKSHQDCINWHIVSSDKKRYHIQINKQESNKY